MAASGPCLFVLCNILVEARKDREISNGKQTRASYRNDQLKITDKSNSLELIRITEARVGSQDKSDWNQLDVSYTKDQLKTTEEGRSTAETDTPKIKENIETCLLVTAISAFAWLILLPLLLWFCFKVIKEKVSKGNGCDNTLKNDFKVAEMDTTKQTKSSTQRKSKNGNKIEQKKQEDTGSTNPSESPNEAAT
ncbi:Hypothetical predicted protein [Mytilus galloprovincialis]|uniref:Uncharacterized protein n=1 Tax=Mytilus galloprovincialis TaxID=29158 RepID=A0A8B6G4N5_MYTGA|nr:Hypothetical predicted protein [Mytilus galloprovincialis]